MGGRGQHRAMLKTSTFTTSSQLSQPLTTGISIKKYNHGKFSTQHQTTVNHQPRDQLLLGTSKAGLLGPQA